jgi:hypothetical protein
MVGVGLKPASTRYFMRISFFEEFPTDENLDKLKLIPKAFGTKLYIAAHSLEEFRKFEKLSTLNYRLSTVYWIVLKKWEGYWISPFSVRNALLRTLNEVREEPIEVMLDLENPVHARWLYLLSLPNFSRNKRFISEFIEKATPKITLVELPGDDEKLKIWGLAYETETSYIARMFYTSVIKWSRERRVSKLREVCEQGVERYGNRFQIGLGCIAKGVSGVEPILSPEELKEDLQTAKESKVSEAIIFRLGGLTQDYIKAIESVI